MALCYEFKGDFEASINEQFLFFFHVNINSYCNLSRLVAYSNSFFWANISTFFKEFKSFGNFLSRTFNLELDLFYFLNARYLTIFLKVV
jgi:nuclear transport factor 2 (NTF2) superfamily protein